MTYPVRIELLTNSAYGARHLKPTVLICIHITANLGTAQNQRDYANRQGSGGPSAHDYINRDGSVVHAIDTSHWAWSNGDLNNPKTALAIVQKVLAVKRTGRNPNEAYVREVECTGDGSNPVTAKQLETVAQMIAADSKATGIVPSRATVGQHSDLNTVDRPHCANLSEAQLAAVIARAKAIIHPPAPAPVPVPTPTPVPVEVDVPVLATYIPGTVATVKATANIRSAPKIAGAILRTLASNETWVITGTVVGDVDPDGGSNVWYCRFAGGKWEYTAKANLISGPTDPTIDLKAQIAADAVALAQANAKIVRAKADLA